MNQLQATALRSMMVKEHHELLKPVVTTDALDSTTAKRLLDMINRMHDESTGDLTIAQLRLDVQSTYHLKLDVQDEMETAINQIASAYIEDPQVLKSVMRRFLARHQSLKAAQYIGSHVDDDDYDPLVAYKMMESAANSAVILDAEVIDFANAGSPAEPTRTGVTDLGIGPTMRGYLDGGGANGELIIFLAPAGVGKTSFLWNGATKAANAGRNVLGITLEINGAKCTQRADQVNTGFNKEELRCAPGVALDKRDQMKGNLWIKDWCAFEPTVDDIRSLVLQMRKRGQDVDYLMVDYMELVRPSVYDARNPRFNYSNVAKGLRALAAELNVPVVTAWQTNRLGSEVHFITKQHVGEDWGIVKIADIILGLNQNEEELRSKYMRVNILKQRESTNRSYVNLYCDLDRMKIMELDAAREEGLIHVGANDSEASAGSGEEGEVEG